MQQHSIQFAIPIRPHLKKFILYIEHLPADGTLILSGTSFIASLIKQSLVGKTRYHVDKNAPLPANFSDTLNVAFPIGTSNKGKLFMTPSAIREFNSLSAQYLNEHLLQIILINQGFGIKENDTIWKFMDQLGLTDTDDITWDALKKASYRLRESKKMKKFRIRNCRGNQAPSDDSSVL